MFSKLNIQLKKWHKTVLGILLFFVILLIFLPSIARVYIERNSVELVGRKISIDAISINYFKFSLRVEEFKMYELNEEDEFVSFDEFYIDYHLWPIFQNVISVSDFDLVNPTINIEVKSDTTYNFSDLLTTDELEEEMMEIVEEELMEEDTVFNLLPYKVDIDGVDITGGRVSVKEEIKNQEMQWEDLSLLIPNIAWDNTQSNAKFDVKLGPTGKLIVSTEVDPGSGDFDLGFELQTINLNFFQPYIADFLRIEDFTGTFDLQLALSGNAKEPESTNLGGSLMVSDIMIKEPGPLDLFAMKSFAVGIEKISLRDSIVHLNSVEITSPAVNATLLKEGGTNFERVLAPLTSTDESIPGDVEADSTVEDAEASMPFEVKLDSFRIIDARLEFHDSTLTIPFNYVISDFDFSTYGLDNKLSSLPIEMSALLNNTGNFRGSGLLNPSNPMDIEFEAHVDDMQLVPFTNYSLEYIARPITRGTYYYDMDLDMTDTTLVNNNRIRFEQLRFGDREPGIEKKVNVPIKTAIYMVEDPKGFADFDVDIKGNPSDPNFKIWPIVWQVLGNTMVKVALEPFNFLSKSFGLDPEKVKTIQLDYLQDSISTDNLKTLEMLMNIHEKKPDLKFGFVLVTNIEKEKEAIAIRKMKEFYLVNEQKVNPDSLANFISGIDEAKFNQFVERRAGEPVPDIGDYALRSFNSSVNTEYEALLNSRLESLDAYFTESGAENLEYRVRKASSNRMRTEGPDNPYFEVVVSTKGEEFFSEEKED